MRDEDKPYVCVRNGWMVQITPRNAEGWRGMGLWLLALVVLTGGFVMLVSTEPGPVAMLVITAFFLVAIAGWAILMIRWMMARSEFIEMDDVAAYKRERKRRKKR